MTPLKDSRLKETLSLMLPMTAKLLLIASSCFNVDLLAQDTSAINDSTANATAERKVRARGIVVNEDGKPQGGIRVHMHKYLEPTSTETDSEGRFSFAISDEFDGVPALLAESSDGTLMGFAESTLSNEVDRLAQTATDRRIVLKPVKTVHVTVIAADGQPVAGATVEALGYPVSFVGSKTDRAGHATILVHPDADISEVIAISDEHGFDYVSNDESRVGYPRCLPNGTISLKLHKPYRAKVRVVDSNDQPLSDADVDPWTVKLPGKLGSVNFSMSSITSRRTNKEGFCEFPWFPADASVSVNPYLSGYYTPEQKRCSTKDPNGTAVFHMMKEAAVSGNVIYPDGKPAAGITIIGEGRGATNNYFRRSTFTNSEGKYKFGIFPDQSTIITIANNDWAAKSHTDISLKEGEHRANVDFQLIKGTRIHGKVSIGATNEPLKGKDVTLIENGAKLPDAIRKRFGDRTGELMRWAKVDSNGDYDFRVGPGNYTLFFPNIDSQTNRTEINVTDQVELTYDNHSIPSRRMQLSGRIVDTAGQPVDGALVDGQGLGKSRIPSVTLRADSKGEFKINRSIDTDEYCFYVHDPGRNLAGLAILPTNQTDVTLKAEPGVILVGRILDASHSPVENQSVVANSGFEQQQYNSIAARATTDKDGIYQIPGLAVGARCSVSVLPRDKRLSSFIFKLEKPGEMKVEDIVLPGPDVKQKPKTSE